jgi:PAS domain S-box-containing protein
MEVILGLTLPQWAAVITIVLGLLALFKRVRRTVAHCWVKLFGRSTKQLLKEHIASEEGQLTRIEAQFKVNDGHSLRDLMEEVRDRQYDFEGMFHAQYNIGQNALFWTDAKGKVLSNNVYHQHLTGFSKAQVQGDGWINVIHPDWREKVHDQWNEAVKDGRDFSEDIMYIKPVTKESYMVHVNVYRELDRNDNIRGYLGEVTLLGD